ncbi:hypothetical protein EBZ70_04765 [bacterium]|jgi:hypothetical protein|nr:hypothetical protein [bacterium]
MATDLAHPAATVCSSAPVNVTLEDLVSEGLSIQHRFAPEPIYGRTGKGFLHPSGVDEIAEAKVRNQVSSSANLNQ